MKSSLVNWSPGWLYCCERMERLTASQRQGPRRHVFSEVLFHSCALNWSGDEMNLANPIGCSMSWWNLTELWWRYIFPSQIQAVWWSWTAAMFIALTSSAPFIHSRDEVAHRSKSKLECSFTFPMWFASRQNTLDCCSTSSKNSRCMRTSSHKKSTLSHQIYVYSSR